MQYLLSFLEGIITFVSPCMLPMLPIYITYFAGGEGGRRRTLINALGFVAGFSIVFVTLGAFAGVLGGLLKSHAILVNLVGGGLIVLLGLNYMGALKLPLLNRTAKMNFSVGRLGFLTSLLFGVIFSIGWTPCVGAFLGSALMLAASSHNSSKGIFLLLFYSIGLGIPFVLSALLLDRLKSSFDFIKKHYKIINTLSGALLVAVGIAMMTGILGRFLAILTF